MTKRMRRSMAKKTYIILILMITTLLAVGCKRDQEDSLTQDRPAVIESSESSLQKVASALNLKAFTEEEKLTRLLQRLAKDNSAQLRGLEHRLKTKSSTLRKLKKMHLENPKVSVASLKISDTLRYTLEISDEPKGHYVKVIQLVFKTLETEGHQVVKVKNYWPKGDNYSGVNAVLSTSKGFEWELQFHTPASYREAKQSHEMYEKLRAAETPLADRQSLFTEMAKPWEQIGIPSEVLTPMNLHPKEEIKKWDAPQ